MRANKGFTLIEVMIVLAIIAILAAVAIPSYSGYVKRGRITEAMSGLSGMGVRLEQYFQDNRTYVGACVDGTVAPLPSAGHFAFACSNLGAATYTVTATGQDSMAGFAYTLSQGGARATTAVPSGWTASANCWVVKEDGSCS
jgi:type IV pilus assembly protein PilE